MRKKVFIIHGRGEKDGLGDESGGDLDTVASNAFYGAWFQKRFREETGEEPTYGEDYEFDFVNYQEGFRHLDAHEEADVYLPDFPIDAMAPRLEIRRVREDREVEARHTLYEHADEIRKHMYRNSGQFPDGWKTAYNSFKKNVGKVRGDRKYYEIEMARYYAGIFHALVRQVAHQNEVGDVPTVASRWLFGDQFEEFQQELDEVLDSNLKRNLVDEIDAQHVQTRLTLDDSSRTDFGRKSRQMNGEQLLASWVEAASTIVGTSFMLPAVEQQLSPDQRQKLVNWCLSIRNNVMEYNQNFYQFVADLAESNPGHPTVQSLRESCQAVRRFWEDLQPDQILESYDPDPNTLRVMVTEEATGRPVPGLEVVYNVKEGEAGLSPVDDPGQSLSNLSVMTDDRGTAAVRLEGNAGPDKFAVTATHDDLNFVTFPKEVKLSRDYFDEHPDPDSVELQMVEYLVEPEDRQNNRTNVEAIEYDSNDEADRATQLQARLMQEEIRYLREQDVHLVRIDDHHPYDPVLLDALNDLRKEGLIEDIRLSSLPAGQHQPKEEQRCGADLIYDGFVEDTNVDNPGMKRLQQEAHFQDLHIKESELAIELSKLIGSKYSKIEMVEGLMEVETGDQMDSIMEIQGWDQAVQEYEDGLEKVLPRVEKTLHRARFVIPPDTGNYEDHVEEPEEGFMDSLTGAFGGEDRPVPIKQRYAEQTGNYIDFFAALSPFCDPEKGEPTINVASALNYLKPRHDFDYYFYAYGSFLLSSRRVNEDCYDVDLSLLVSKIGSPSDGGHAAAATGSPSSNPAFPVERFNSVNDRNLTEYFYYVFDIVDGELDLDWAGLREQLPVDYEDGMETVLERVCKYLERITLTTTQGDVDVIVGKGEFTDAGEPELAFPMIVSEIRDRHDFDYFFYARSAKDLVMRNVNDTSERLDLDEVARTIGTFRDGGHPKAAQCQPKFNPDFDEDAFEYINSDVLGDLAEYFAQCLQSEHSVTDYSVKSV